MDIQYKGLPPRARTMADDDVDVEVESGYGGEFELELECQRQFGDEKFSFYHPECVGNFVLYTYSLSAQPGKHHNPKSSIHGCNIYAAIIYEDGEVVDFSKDARFKTCRWVRKNTNSKDHAFSRQDLIQMIADMENISNMASNCRTTDLRRQLHSLRTVRPLR